MQTQASTIDLSISFVKIESLLIFELLWLWNFDLVAMFWLIFTLNS